MNQVKGEEYFMPSEEANEVQCLLVEPQNDHVSVDGILCSRDDKLEQCMEIEDVPYRFGGPASNATGEGEDILKPKVLDVMPLEVEGRNCQAENGVSTTCEDYLLDIGYPESVTNLHYDASGRLHFGNSGSDSQIMGFSCRDNVTIGESDSSTAIILLPQCQNNLPEKTTCELNGNFSCKFVAQTSNEANWLKYPNSESQNVEKMEDVSDLSVTDVSSDENGNDVILSPGFISGGKSCSSRIAENEEASSVGQGVEAESGHGQDLSTKHSVQNSNCSARQKRLRKPTRRYMDESSDLNSRHCLKRQGVSTSTSKDRFLGVRCRKNHHVGSRAIPSSDESFCKAIQVPFSPRGRKECQKKHVSTVMKTSVEESSPDESEDDSVAAVRSEESGGLRKHHKLWTLSEVRKLIDGVSQHGVGKWTQIKKLLFSSSAHRTPVDLKDKWRNLLKASSAQKQSKREDEQRRNQPWRPLPKSMLRRVSELAAIYPYPRGRKFRLSHV